MNSLIDIKNYFSENSPGSAEQAAMFLNEDKAVIESAAAILVEKGILKELQPAKCKGCALDCAPSCLSTPKLYQYQKK